MNKPKRRFSIMVLAMVCISQPLSADDVEVNSWLRWLPFVYIVPEGSVGIFQSFGSSFSNDVLSPGWGGLLSWPTTSTILVNVRPQIDVITNIPCGTADGLSIRFPRVAVYNQLKEEHALDVIKRFGENYDHYLITEPVIQAVAELCTEKTARELYIDEFSGLNEYLKKQLVQEQMDHDTHLIINRVVISKPELPESIQSNYESLVKQKSLLEVAVEQQALELKKKETERLSQTKQAETQRQIAEIESKQQLAMENGQAEQQKIKISVRMHELREKADAVAYAARQEAEANAYHLQKEGVAKAEITRREAEVNATLLTPAYIEKLRVESFWRSSNTKYYFGNQIPAFLYSTELHGTDSTSTEDQKKSDENTIEPLPHVVARHRPL